MKNTTRLFALCLVVCSLLLSLAACSPRFDYRTEDMTKYVSFDTDPLDIKFSAKSSISDQDVYDNFNAFFSDVSNPFYRPIEDETRAIANGDELSLVYCGVTISALNSAVADNKIADVNATGLSYTEIVDLGIGFDGGTATSLTRLKIGSNTYIPGFESGLVGYVPAENGEDNPVRLRVTFPTNYGSADLAGKEVIFFCKLYHIGDTAGYYTHENIDVDMLNLILGKTGDKCYAALESCFTEIRKHLEDDMAENGENYKLYALYDALCEAATYTNLPTYLVDQYIDDWFDSRIEYLKEFKASNPSYFEYYFGDAKIDRDLAAYAYGYSENYMEELAEEANEYIRQETVFRYIVQTMEFTLTDEDYEYWDAEYIQRYGEGYAEDVAKDEVRDQFLREKVNKYLLDEA
ncbi:MAG: hypothetical protein J6T24_07345, partial [Clostridia bacterium]|nr:hypothetical protein [Clostridia bacterium]